MKDPLHFDFVILAIPPTVWDDIEFNPKLTDEYRVQMGTAIKYLSNVKDRFWIDQKTAPSSSSDDYGNTWEGTDNQMLLDRQGIALNLFAGGRAANNARNAIDPVQYLSNLLEA